jgi:5-methyltetrahydropteroyltriglutamate--homocysteine methyltransferase
MRTRPPFRADHVGSLLRPTEVTDARRRFEEGAIGLPELRRVEDAAVAEVVRMQEHVGLQSATDGELRRRSWHMDFLYQLGGLSRVDHAEEQTYEFRNLTGTVTSAQGGLATTGKIALEHPVFVDDFAAVRDSVRAATAKLTIPSPILVYSRGGRAMIDDTVYPDVDEFWDDLTAAYSAELESLYAAGCRYIQFDDTSYAELCDEHEREALRKRGEDPDELLETWVTQLNRVLSARQPDMAATVHTCRGNFRSSWGSEGAYDPVAERLFGELEVDGFFLEFDDERSGGFEPLRFVRPESVVVLGLVTSKRGELEHPDDLRRRIDEASRFVPLERLCLSPQCGFASVDVGNDLTHDQQWAKLELVVQTAEEVWG